MTYLKPKRFFEDSGSVNPEESRNKFGGNKWSNQLF